MKATQQAVRRLILLCTLFLVTGGIAWAQPEVFFDGSESSDYNTDLNWDLNLVPLDPEDATIGDPVFNPNAVATLDATALAHRDFRIGKLGATGVLNHSAGTLTTNNWAFIGVDSTDTSASSGTYNLTGSATYAQTTTIEARFEIGGRGDESNPAQGLVHVDTTGSITTNNASVGTNGNGRFELVNGTHNSTGFLNIGTGFDSLDGGTGVYEQTGGVLNVDAGMAPFGGAGWFSIANGSASTGTYNLSGGTVNLTVDYLTVGDNGMGTLNIDGTSGSPDVNIGASGMIVGRNDGATGMLNVISDGATIDTTNLIVAANDTGASTTATGTLSFTSASSVSPINASGDVTLGTNAMLDIDFSTSPPPAGDVLLIDVAGTLTGEFAGLAEGTAVPGSDGRVITYGFGDGNDIALLVGSGVIPGDTNGDGIVNFGDLSPFVLALTDAPAYEADFPGLYPESCDITGDELCNFQDLSPFADLLTPAASGTANVPEPAGLTCLLIGLLTAVACGRRRFA